MCFVVEKATARTGALNRTFATCYTKDHRAMTGSNDASKSDDSKGNSDGDDEFLEMDPGAFDSVDDLFADPSMTEGDEGASKDDEPADD